MGLQEKQWIKQFQDEFLPKVLADLKDVVKTDIPYEVDYNSFASDLAGLQSLEDQLRELNNAFRAVVRHSGGSDESVAMGAVKEGVKKIVVKNAATPADKKITFSNGVLELHTACGKSGGRLIDSDMKPVIEAGL